MMKKYCITALVFTLAAANMTACSVGANNDSKDTDLSNSSSYYSVNYTDVGEETSSHSNVSESVGRSQIEQDTNTAKNAREAAQNKNNSNPENDSQNAKSSSETSSGITNKTTVTYYYTDEEGEQHSTDTSIDTPADGNDSDNSSSAATFDSKTSSPEDDEKNSDSDVQSEISDNTDTDTQEAVDSDDIEVSQGFFAEEDLIFYYNGSPIMLGENIDDVVATIGEPGNIKENTFDDDPDVTNKVYFYDGFSIEATSGADDSVYTVITIEVFDRSLSTEKGVHIDMTVEEIKKIYGQEDEIVDGEYRYYSGDRYLFLGVQNDVVSDLGYRFGDISGNDETI